MKNLQIVEYEDMLLWCLEELSLDWGDHFWKSDEILRSIAAGDKRLFFVLVDSQAAGMIFFSIASLESELLFLFIRDNFRHQGLARRLMKEYFATLKTLKIDSLFLEVRESNTGAQALYQSLEYRLIGRRPRYYRDGESALVMKKEL
ncbi:GNAT family N-acetyltransferase [Pseudobacteriovorax antillogorgiicola]|uniref:Ribosomal-protein-alanine N-acetyltransferase n=1 Tax=Pseudobacteriovorax antillogorgiicola TaxID=1513793 RepID=A0A1Y6CNG9_9BACT|nr:GNAT family N-acetyltransferase [Pseudobacteriovorax antillogorgiicola]TCS44429.1 ribosomal-protein-alanine N-acetyltransferase [Pseudobacteriovorax antillogorgiicola]SMF78982.1 ribosomal-protein-alanine N-acetyltransferase [Pseudobacteriovorax antillogorgiicola]